MTREYLIDYLRGEGCYPDEDTDYIVGEMWTNCINFEMCLVPFDNELSIMTWGHIIYELRLDPPLEFDADYHVYQGFRERLKDANER